MTGRLAEITGGGAYACSFCFTKALAGGSVPGAGSFGLVASTLVCMGSLVGLTLTTLVNVGSETPGLVVTTLGRAPGDEAGFDCIEGVSRGGGETIARGSTGKTGEGSTVPGRVSAEGGDGVDPVPPRGKRRKAITPKARVPAIPPATKGQRGGLVGDCAAPKISRDISTRCPSLARFSSSAFFSALRMELIRWCLPRS